MQLAILLSLIHTRGSSLPDKRTALYDSYIDLFFNREAEKSPIVRNHRDLLINIHRYLAWLLHTEVEIGGEHEPGNRSGAIASDRLTMVLKKYLENEGHDPDLAQELFTGVVERVVALVSRVQGTYEFEVQPLREYFAARFLYETAPYSPPGIERRGTKPDRFDAIARNFYWLNVTRFYAGCYSKGELASLIDRLQELIKDDDYGLTNHPRILGAILLSDWVFSQHPKSVIEVVNFMLDGIGLRFVLTSSSRRVERSNPLVLPEGCGKKELINRCLSLLRKQPPLDYALDIIDLLKANISSDEILSIWLDSTLDVSQNERTHWLEYGLQLGCLSNLPKEQLEKVLSDQPLKKDRINLLLRANRFDFLEDTEDRFVFALKNILNGDTQNNIKSRIVGTVSLLVHCLNPRRYAVAFGFRHKIPLSEAWKHHSNRQVLGWPKKVNITISYPEADNCYHLFKVVRKQTDRMASLWATDLSPWDIIVEEGRRLWGDQWALYQIATVASGIKSSTETCTDCPDLFDDSKPLCRRSRYARLRAGTASWWSKQLKLAETTMQKLQATQLWLTWASKNTIISSLEQFNSLIDGLEDDDWARLFDSARLSIALTHQPEYSEIEIDASILPFSISPRTCAALFLRTKRETDIALYDKFLAHYNGGDLRILKSCQNIASHLLRLSGQHWQDYLPMVARCFAKGAVSERFAYQHFIRQTPGTSSIPLDCATQIIRNADQYPGFLVAIAESTCRQNVAKKIVPVSQVAEREKWFES